MEIATRPSYNDRRRPVAPTTASCFARVPFGSQHSRPKRIFSTDVLSTVQFGAWRVHRRSRRTAKHSQEDQAPICCLQAEYDDASCVLRLTPAARCDAWMRLRCNIDSSTAIDTPGNTPRRTALQEKSTCMRSRVLAGVPLDGSFLSLARSDACGCARLQTEAADHLARPRMPAFRIGWYCAEVEGHRAIRLGSSDAFDGKLRAQLPVEAHRQSLCWYVQEDGLVVETHAAGLAPVVPARALTAPASRCAPARVAPARDSRSRDWPGPQP